MQLSQRVLNRALLDRQSLLHRAHTGTAAMIERLVGLQAQLPVPPYVGLWSRVEGFDPEDLSGLLLERTVVRVVLMRGTIHLVTAADCLALRALLQPMLRRQLMQSAFGKHLRTTDLDRLGKVARQLVEHKPMTAAELRTALAGHFPDVDPASLAAAARALVPLVHIPPRGLWRRTGPIVCTSAQSWLGQDLPAPDPEAVVQRYLSAFGPATVTDAQAWSGLTRLREVFERLPLRTYRSEAGAELFDVPDKTLPDPDTPAPVRFLPPWDNALLSHADRTRILSDSDRKTRINSVNGIVPGTVLVDGTVHGAWKIDSGKDMATMRIHLFRRLSPRDKGSVRSEGERLLSFSCDAARREIQFTALS